MSIKLRSGTPSSGKSYTSIEDILTYLNKGKFVISNFPLLFTKRDLKRGYDKRFFHVPNKELTVEYLLIFAIEHGMIEACKEDQCLVVIDEAGGRFNVVQPKKSDIQEWADFFSQHAKLGFSFVLIAQKDRMINRGILPMIETEVKHRKVNNFKFFKYLPFTLFLDIEFWYVNKTRVSSQYHFYLPSVAKRYDRFKLFDGFKLSEALLKKITDIQAELPKGFSVPISAISSNSDEE